MSYPKARLEPVHDYDVEDTYYYHSLYITARSI